MRKIFIYLFLTGCPADELFSSICVDSCYTGEAETRNIGICRDGDPVCEDGQFVSCKNEILPDWETCDRLDNDCDGETDNSPIRPDEINLFCGADRGTCFPGMMNCIAGTWQCVGATEPESEICDHLDNDCDGLVDNLTGEPEFCYSGDYLTLRSPNCHAGITVCRSGVEFCINQQLPQVETCDGLDNDCDGFIDEDIDETEIDIIFILDRSSSMYPFFDSVVTAAELFVNAFSTDTRYRFALLVIPSESPDTTDVWIVTDLTDASTFLALLLGLPSSGSGTEASIDAVYLTPTELDLSWRDGWKFIILFTDEEGQTYLDPPISLAEMTTEIEDSGIVLYAFGTSASQTTFENVALSSGGGYSRLGPAMDMEESLRGMFAFSCGENQ